MPLRWFIRPQYQACVKIEPMEPDPTITDEEVSLLLTRLSYGLANQATIEFSYLPRAADELVTEYRWSLRHAPEDLPQMFGEADVVSLPARVRRLSPRGRADLLDAVIRMAGGTRPRGWSV